MWRLMFLILVVLGALTGLLVVILGLGVAKVAWVQSDDVASPTVPVTDVPPTAPPASQAAHSPAPSPQPDLKPVVAPGPGPQGVVEAPAVIPPADFVPGTIVLRGADARVHGRMLRKTDGDLTSWARIDDYATWTFNPPRGKYRVLVTRANGANSGGDFALAPGDGRKSDPFFLARAAPTGGWDTFRTEMIGVLDLEEKRTALSLRPAGEVSQALMRLRKIELVPAEPMPPARADDDGIPAIRALTLVEAATGKPLGQLTNAMTLDISTMPPFSIRAETAGKVGSVRFNVNKGDGLLESERPFSIAGDRDNRYTPWTPSPGRQTIIVTPYREPGGGGVIGKKEMLMVKVIAASPVVLSARDAIRHGATIRLHQDGEPTITAWTSAQDWIEWNANVTYSGRYEVEILYSAAKGHGGDFVLRVGEARLSDDIRQSGGWELYERMRVGEVKLPRGQTRVAIKPDKLGEGKMLMNLREVRLTPVDTDDD